MAYTKRAAKGTLLRYDSGSSTFVTVPGVQDFDYPRGSAERLDVTSHDSAGNRKEYIPGFIDPESFDVPILWDNGAAGSPEHAVLEAAYAGGLTKTFRVTTVDGKTYTFAGLVTNIAFNAPVQGVFKATVTIQPTGAETVG